MRCMYCGHSESRVVDSRPADDGVSIRRRRECEGCARRFTTYEKIEKSPLYVVKRNGTLQAFDSGRIRASILKSCEKRSVSLDVVEHIVGKIEMEIHNAMVEQISTREIGEMVMDALRDVDEVAYVRFASVYRQFKDIETFRSELDRLLSNRD